MFGLRSDGKKIKNVEPFQKIVPHIMSARHDAQNLFEHQAECEPLDVFINEMRFCEDEEKRASFNYLHITIASVVRLFALRPQLNRFVMNGRIFKRNNIQVSFVVKKQLSDDAVGTTVKLTFDGTESIYDVKKVVDDAIRANSDRSAVNGTDNLAKFLTAIPNGLIKFAVGTLKWLDKHGMLPKSVIALSPFHTSCFITNMKSIKTDFIYHHLYDFGTTGCFIAIGKEGLVPVVQPDKTIGIGKRMGMGIVTDERFCDGLYYANSLKLLQKMMRDPAQLLTKLEKKVEDVD